MQVVKWLTGTAPHSTADRFSAFVISGTNGTSTHNSGCNTVGTGNSGVNDTCVTATVSDTSRSTANNSPVAVAIAAPTASAPVPTLSQWGIIALSSLMAMAAIARVRRRQR
ncbi:IPTL-CTERM sorting domain-containing protein [Xylophilus sp. ASV27]|uniref:IPTL-CTERM sorting domain-containing protein n=1 Tax=Xylophilus sp. ASV27 TaxID=2795129 RepID=UPI0018EA4ACE|nr:IPTL-CTERM sorting domain-containing protein [Xylophilus sp. ASV27]